MDVPQSSQEGKKKWTNGKENVGFIQCGSTSSASFLGQKGSRPFFSFTQSLDKESHPFPHHGIRVKTPGGMIDTRQSHPEPQPGLSSNPN
jgi:hypothetical protein